MPALPNESASVTVTEYTICSGSFSNETADGLVGPGRTLGLFYGILGKKLEDAVGRVAEKVLHSGPRETAQSIKAIHGNPLNIFWHVNAEHRVVEPSPQRHERVKQIRKKCERLEYYLRSDVPSTRAQALDQIVNLSVHSEPLRKLLAEVAFRTIYILHDDPTTWYNMDASLQARIRKALIVLEENEINSIMSKFCCEHCGNSADLVSELRPYLFHKDYSFLVVRYFSRTYGLWMHQLLADFVTQIPLLAFEDFVEWRELDVLLVFIDNGGVLNSIFRYSQRLPRSAVKIKEQFEAEIEKMDPTDLDELAKALAKLHMRVMEMHLQPNFSYAISTDPLLRDVHRRILSPPDRALGIICRNYKSTIISERNRLDGYVPLAIFIDSDDPYYQSRAMYGINITLRLTRYTRHMMIQTLSNTKFSSTKGYYDLIRNTSASIASNCFEDTYTFYRHCASTGKLLHTMVNLESCRGDCGAVIEEVLRIGSNLILDLKIEANGVFAEGSHRPLFVGCDSNGENLYIASLVEHNRQKTRACFYYGRAIAITDGTQEKDIAMEVHYANSSTKTLQACDNFDLRVPVLRYEPSANLPDGTGPSDWKFNRHLPTTDHRLYGNEPWRVTWVGSVASRLESTTKVVECLSGTDDGGSGDDGEVISITEEGGAV